MAMWTDNHAMAMVLRPMTINGTHEDGPGAVTVDSPAYGWRRAGGEQTAHRRSTTDERPAPSGFVGNERYEDSEGQAAGRVADEHAAAGGAQHDPPVVEGNAPGDVGDQDVHGGKVLTGDPVQRGDGIIAKASPGWQLFQRTANGEGL